MEVFVWKQATHSNVLKASQITIKNIDILLWLKNVKMSCEFYISQSKRHSSKCLSFLKYSAISPHIIFQTANMFLLLFGIPLGHLNGWLRPISYKQSQGTLFRWTWSALTIGRYTFQHTYFRWVYYIIIIIVLINAKWLTFSLSIDTMPVCSPSVTVLASGTWPRTEILASPCVPLSDGIKRAVKLHV